MIFLDNNNNCEFAKYFTNLGYEYSWDYSGSEYWHELYKNGTLILQVQMISLETIIRDMCETEQLGVDYFIASETPALYDELCDVVREFEKKK